MSDNDHPPISSSGRTNMRLRILTALAFIPVVFLLLKGGIIAILIGLSIGAAMSYEAVTIAGRRTKYPVGIAQMVMLMVPAVLAVLPWDIHAVMPPSYVLGMMMIGLAITVKDYSAKIMMASLAACFYGLVSMIMLDHGIQWLILVVASIVAADSAALFGGRALGGAKLAPMISPSKTWSGAICGVAAGGVAGYVAGYILGFPPTKAALAGLFIADASINGDLLESWFKRRHGVKDSGSFLPGHGGFLDRFDGYILAIPFFYLVLIMVFGQAGAAYGG